MNEFVKLSEFGAPVLYSFIMDTQSFITTLEKLLAEDDLISVGRDARSERKVLDFILDLKEKNVELEQRKKEDCYL